MNSRVVVSAFLKLLLGSPFAQGLLDINTAVLAADREPNLARGVGGNGSEAVLGDWEDGAAIPDDLLDQGQVKPLGLSCVAVLV